MTTQNTMRPYMIDVGGGCYHDANDIATIIPVSRIPKDELSSMKIHESSLIDLTNDTGIAKTLIRCKSDGYELLSSYEPETILKNISGGQNYE